VVIKNETTQKESKEKEEPRSANMAACVMREKIQHQVLEREAFDSRIRKSFGFFREACYGSIPEIVVVGEDATTRQNLILKKHEFAVFLW